MADAEKLPLSDNSFHLAFSLETLEHLMNPLAALEEMARILKPGGTLFLSVPVSSRFNAAILRQLMNLRRGGKFHEHLQVYTLKAMLDLVRAAGFHPMGHRFCVFNYPCYEILTRLISYRLWRRLDAFLSRWSMGVVGIKLGFSFCVGNEYLIVSARRDG
jgi:ubiquinone/menaquinone biosynthesis C-methylase UbiE